MPRSSQAPHGRRRGASHRFASVPVGAVGIAETVIYPHVLGVTVTRPFLWRHNASDGKLAPTSALQAVRETPLGNQNARSPSNRLWMTHLKADDVGGIQRRLNAH
jgi:hypothetical protein